MSKSEISFDFNENQSVEEVKSSHLQTKSQRQFITSSQSGKKEK
ncbi:unnamed protein product [Paramecium sonneborni]|uniref:Uncharacterized protein n=1 Tax=Paramecium sonneborni TaxID=65129 RepID=A0A8S1RQL0_9CILI|nr:unnamed protein product [Paramecium sonneborni]